jgi:hypothetical protein
MTDTSKTEKVSQNAVEQPQPAEEWGERTAMARMTASGGKTSGAVDATADRLAGQGQPVVVALPAPSGESSPDGVRKTRAVANALTRLGEIADPKRVAEAVRDEAGIDINEAEVAQICAVLRERARTPPGPDQPPPENSQPRPAQPATS